MLKYHFTLQDTQAGETVEYDTGRTSNWRMLDVMDGVPESPHKRVLSDFVWAAIAAEQAGKKGDLGITDEMGYVEAAELIADKYDRVQIDDNTLLNEKQADAPLA